MNDSAAALKPNDQTLGLALALVGTTLFAFKAVLIKLAFQAGADPLLILVFRMAFSLPVYLVIGWIVFQRQGASGITGESVLITAVLGLLSYYVASFLDFSGLQLVSAQLERMILFLYPTFVALMAALFLKEQITPRVLMALACAYGGVALLFGREFTLFGEDTLTGGLLVLGAAVTFAIYATFAKPMIARLGSALFTVLAMTAASLGVFVHFALARDVSDLVVSSQVLWLTFAMAIFSTVVPSFMMAEAIKRLGAAQAGIVGGFGPVATSVFAISLLGEVFTPFHLGGIVLAIIGIVLLTTTPKRT